MFVPLPIILSLWIAYNGVSASYPCIDNACRVYSCAPPTDCINDICDIDTDKIRPSGDICNLERGVQSACNGISPICGADDSDSTTTSTSPETTSSDSSTTASESSTTVSELTKPTRYLLEDGESYDMSIQECAFSTDSLSYTAFCYCWGNGDDADCSVPGPTLLIYAGSQVSVTFTNYLSGSSEEQSELSNLQYKDMGITNMHTHGFHVDPAEDDVTIQIAPNGGSVSYTFTIPEDHYPGTHWLHPHHHGAASWQIGMGLFSLFIVEYAPDSTAYSGTNEILQYGNTDAVMPDFAMVISSMYAVNAEDCDCDNRDEWATCLDDRGNCDTEWLPDGNMVVSHCYEYCDFEEEQRAYYTMDMQAANSGDMYHFVNGQENGQLQVVAGEYTRLRFLSTNTQQTIQLSLPDGCDWQLLALDGIYLQQNSPRDLSADPYLYQLVLFSATRADVAVNCPVGEYSVVTSQEDPSEVYRVSKLKRVDADYELFTINAVESSEGTGIDDISSLTFPDKPTYLSNNCDDSTVEEVVNECPCQRMNLTLMPNKQQDEIIEGVCTVAFSMGNKVETNAFLNGLSFDPTTANDVWRKDEVYEVDVYSGGHPYHQHTFPFQIVSENNWFYGAQCDWRDTYGYTDDGEGLFTLRTRLADFSGVVIEHCHWLPHEDYGMMGWKYVSDDDSVVESCEYPSLGETVPAAPMTVPDDNEAHHDVINNNNYYYNTYNNGDSDMVKVLYRIVVALLAVIVLMMVYICVCVHGRAGAITSRSVYSKIDLELDDQEQDAVNI